jgi:hypothetical protein
MKRREEEKMKRGEQKAGKRHNAKRGESMPCSSISAELEAWSEMKRKKKHKGYKY